MPQAQPRLDEQEPPPDARVTDLSAYGDDTWLIPNEVPGAGPARVHLSRTPAAWMTTAKLTALHAVRRWEAASDRAAASLAKRLSALPALLRLVEGRGWRTLRDVPATFVEDLFADVREEIAEGGYRKRTDSTIGPGGALRDDGSWAALTALMFGLDFLVELAPGMRALGLDALPEGIALPGPPESCAKRLTDDRKDRTPPLPDEVVDAIANAAGALLGDPADELVEALRAWYDRDPADRHDGPAPCWSPDADGKPWPEKIEPGKREAVVPTNVIRHALWQIVSACDIVLFYSTGYRASEHLASRGGRREGAALPDCVTSRPSRSRLHELFFVESLVSKGSDEPRPEKWLIGARAIGSAALPPAVRALDVLDRVFAQLRRGATEAAGIDDLTFTIRSNGLPGERTPISRRSSFLVRWWIRQFLRAHVTWEALPDTSRTGADIRPYKAERGMNVRPTHFRKTLVAFMMRVDQRLRTPLALHLKHLTAAILDEHYTPADLSLQLEIDEARSYELARLLYGVATGETSLPPAARSLESQILALTRGLQGLDEDEAVRFLQDKLRGMGVGLHGAGPFRCLVELMPSRSVCNRLAGIPASRVRRPVARHRTPGNCGACACGARDGATAADMTARYVSARRAFLLERAAATHERREAGMSPHRVLLSRAELAASVLAEMKAPVPSDEDLMEGSA